MGKPGAQGTGEAGDWGQEGADAQGSYAATALPASSQGAVGEVHENVAP